MELDELHVRDSCPGAPRDGHPVARRDIRVGRVKVDLAAAAGGQHHPQCPERFDLAGRFVEDVNAQAPVLRGEAQLGARDEVHGEMAFEHLDVRMLCHGAQQRALDLACPWCRANGARAAGNARLPARDRATCRPPEPRFRRNGCPFRSVLRMRAGPSLTTVRTAASSHSPSPASSVSLMCSSKVSSSNPSRTRCRPGRSWCSIRSGRSW